MREGGRVDERQIRFNDGAAYERMMGTWSRLTGEIFLDWVAPQPGLRWIDIGCGSGALSELLIKRCAPAEVIGIDPSEEQLAFARARPAAGRASFHQGDAMSLPFAADRFDAAVMALVLFYVPEPAAGLAEMVRVTAPGGSVSAYVWDLSESGSPTEPIHAEMRAMGLNPLRPPSAAASGMGALQHLWFSAGLSAVTAREITVSRTFADFDDFWATTIMSPNIGSVVAAMPSDDIAALRTRVQARVPPDAAGRISYVARANAISGRVA